MNIVDGSTINTDVIAGIVDTFDYVDDQQRKAAIDAVNNNVYPRTDLEDLTRIAAQHAADLTVTIYVKDGNEYPHGGDTWQVPAVDAVSLPIGSGEYGMRFLYYASNSEGEVIGSWYADDANLLLHELLSRIER